MKRNIIDHVELTVRAGNGGNGVVSFRREKYIPKGGPDGGDGGNGGSIVLVSNPHMTTLLDYAGKDMYEALPGGRGAGRKMHGKDAKNLTLTVPVGTVVWAKKVNEPLSSVQATYDEEDARSIQKAERYARHKLINRGEFEWEQLIDMNEPGMKFVVAQGGKGGRGNDHFKSSINTTPRIAEPGGYGEEKYLKFEMKILADIGLVGLPNAGKSTLLSVLTAAKPEIDSYPFTTLTPNLGVMDVGVRFPHPEDGDGETPPLQKHQLIIADIPGLIEDAHKGKGLGVEFLRHIERCRVLLYVLSPTDQDLEGMSNSKFQISKELIKQFEIVRNEVKSYGNNVDDKKRLIVINKSDVLDPKHVKKIVGSFEKLGEDVIVVSAATQDNIKELSTRISEIAAI